MNTNKIIIFIKVLGKTDYKTYKEYLSSKTNDELIDIKTNLEVRYSKWNKVLSVFVVALFLSVLSVIGTICYQFIKNAFQIYSYEQAMILTKGIGLTASVISIFIATALLFLYGGLADAKRKIKFIDNYLQEKREREKKILN